MRSHENDLKCNRENGSENLQNYVLSLFKNQNAQSRSKICTISRINVKYF